MTPSIHTDRRVHLLAGLVMLALAGCQTTSPTIGGGGDVSYGDAKAVETVTTDLGSTDIGMIAEKMTQSLIRHPVVQRLIGTNNAITISPVQNKTSEYFDTMLITNRVRRQLVNNDVPFVESINERQNQVDELRQQNQSGLYDKSTTAKMGKMRGAKYRLDGSISSIIKKNSNIKDVYYTMSLRLVEIESNMIKWEEEKDIRKTAKR